MVSIPKRYVIVLMAFCGLLLMTMMEMSSELEYLRNAEKRKLTFEEYFEEFNKITFLFHLGWCFSLVGGMATTRYGGVTIFGSGIALSGLLYLILITPIVPSLLEKSIFVFKFVQGVLHAISSTALVDIWSKWCPIEERSTSAAFIFTSFHFTSIVTSLFSASDSNMVYFHYIAGGIAIIWAVMWLFVVKNHPSEDKNLSNKEKQLLAKRTKFLNTKRVTIPALYTWRQILLSIPVWILNSSAFIMRFAENERLYDDEVFLLLNPNQTITTSLFIIACFLIAGYAADYARSQRNIAPTKIHKMYICVAFVGEIISIIFWMYEKPLIHYKIYLALRTFPRILNQIALFINMIDLSPNYAPLLSGIQKFFMSLANIVMIIKTANETYSLLIIILCLIGMIIFYFWSSGEVQPWNSTSNEEEEVEMNTEEI